LNNADIQLNPQHAEEVRLIQEAFRLDAVLADRCHNGGIPLRPACDEQQLVLVAVSITRAGISAARM
jgi:hypothetical protein